MTDISANRQISNGVKSTSQQLHVSVEQAAVSSAATKLGKTGTLLLPNGKTIGGDELRGATKQAGLDKLLEKNGYSAGSIKLADFVLFCDDVAESKGAVGGCHAVPTTLLKTGEYGTQASAAPIARPTDKAQAPTLPRPGGADRVGTTVVQGPIRFLPPSAETKAKAATLLSKGTLTLADQKQLTKLAQSMVPPGVEADPRAGPGALMALFRSTKTVVTDDAREAALAISKNVEVFKFEMNAPVTYQLEGSMLAQFAPTSLSFAPPKAPTDVEDIVDQNIKEARHDTWTPSMIKATPYAFANALTQVDGDKATIADQTVCGPMSMVGAVALADPQKLPGMAKAILANPTFFAHAQTEPFKAALSRVVSGNFSPADCNLMARAMYAGAQNDPNATSGLTDDQLKLLGKALALEGFKFPRIEIHAYGSADPTTMGHYNGFAGTNFDPWPGADGKTVLQSRDEAVARHGKDDRKLLSTIIFDGTNIK